MPAIQPEQRVISIAPMMNHTDRHFRYLMRLLSKRTLLYTEMITTGAVIRGNRDKILQFNEPEHPVGIQLGGGDPDELALSAKIAQDYGYDEINLNVGCPSNRVRRGRFGACLMATPGLVAECVAAMMNAVSVPVSVKSRIGINNHSHRDLHNFIATVNRAGCEIFILHARNALLNGLSPKDNRTVPPLRYETVHQIKRDFPHLHITINGGITSLDQIKRQLEFVDGVMLGRSAYQKPYFLAEIDQMLSDKRGPKASRNDIIVKFSDYAARQIAEGSDLKQMSRHIVGLFQGQPGARAYRRILSEKSRRPNAGVEVISEAMNQIY